MLMYSMYLVYCLFVKSNHTISPYQFPPLLMNTGLLTDLCNLSLSTLIGRVLAFDPGIKCAVASIKVCFKYKYVQV